MTCSKADTCQFIQHSDITALKFIYIGDYTVHNDVVTTNTYFEMQEKFR